MRCSKPAVEHTHIQVEMVHIRDRCVEGGVCALNQRVHMALCGGGYDDEMLKACGRTHVSKNGVHQRLLC